MPVTILTPPPLTQPITIRNGFGNRPWTTWFSSLYKKLGGAGNVGNFYLPHRIDDISVNTTVYLPIPINCYLDQIWVINNATITFTDEVIDVVNNAGSTIKTLTIPVGSPAGTVISEQLTISNAFSRGDKLRLVSHGDSTTSAVGIFTMAFIH